MIFRPPSKVLIEVLQGKNVIIKHNTFFVDHHERDYASGELRLKYQPRFGHIGTFLNIIDGMAEVKFDYGISQLFPLEQVFFLRLDERNIYYEAVSCRKVVKERYGIEAMEANLAFAQALSDGREKDALKLAYNNIFVYHFLSFLNCPDNFPASIEEQRKDDSRFLDWRKELFTMDTKNLLSDLHSIFKNSHIRFRHRVMEDCDMSIFVYHKILKTEEFRMSNANNAVVVREAEEVMDQIIRGIRAYYPKYKYRFDEGDGRRDPCPRCAEMDNDSDDPDRIVSRFN